MFVREFLHLTSRCPRSVEAGCAKSSWRATSGNSSGSLNISAVFLFGFQGKVASELLQFLHPTSLKPGMQLHVIITQHSFGIWMEQWCHWRTASTWSQLCTPRGGRWGLNCAEKQNSPRLNRDHVITRRSKTALREGFGGFGERMWAPSTQLEAVSHLSETRHRPQSDVRVSSPTDRLLVQERQKKKKKEGEEGRKKSQAFQLLGPYSRVQTCSV